MKILNVLKVFTQYVYVFVFKKPAFGASLLAAAVAARGQDDGDICRPVVSPTHCI